MFDGARRRSIVFASPSVSTIVGEIANATADVRAYIVSEIRGLMSDDDFREAIPGFLLPDSASQWRRALLEERLNAIAALD